jgi:hypothetical protein
MTSRPVQWEGLEEMNLRYSTTEDLRGFFELVVRGVLWG